MAPDPSAAGQEPAGQVLLVTRSRLRAFARATGQADPVYLDVDAARRAGHPDLPVPPTFFFSIDLEADDPFADLAEMGIDLRAVLHGEQEFLYHRMAYAGDELSTRSRIADDYEKKGGALRFLVKEVTVSNSRGEAVATMRTTTVVRQLTEVAS